MSQRHREIFPGRGGILFLLLFALLCGVGLGPVKGEIVQAAAGEARNRAASSSASLQRYRNIGKAYYEQGKYGEALDEFQKIIASGQALASDYLNLGWALVQADRLDEALGVLTTAKQMAPTWVAADYALGILYKRQRRYRQAEAALQQVLERDPQDPGSWFNLGSVYLEQRKLEEALAAHRRVVGMGFARAQNFYVVSLFRCFNLLVRLERASEAQKFLELHAQMRDKLPGVALQAPALEAGQYGTIVVPATPPRVPTRQTAGPKVQFLEVAHPLRLELPSGALAGRTARSDTIPAQQYSLSFARTQLVSGFTPSLALGDYDGDGRTDLYLVDPAGSNRLLHNLGSLRFRDVTAEAGVAGPGASLGAIFADYNNSGHASLFVVGLGGITLYRGNGDGRFTDATQQAGLEGPAGELATSAVLFDADNDGLLDLLVTYYADLGRPPAQESFLFPDDFPPGGVRFYRNNGDGTFTEKTEAAGLDSFQGRARRAVFAPFNDDIYMDLLLVRDQGAPQLFLNQGEGKFVDHTAQAGRPLTRLAALDAQVVDLNHDGRFDLVLWTPSGSHLLWNQGEARFAPAPGAASASVGAPGTVTDTDADGFDDLLGVDSSGRWHLWANRGNRFAAGELDLPVVGGQPPPAWLVPAWLDEPGQLHLIVLHADGRLAVWQKESRAGHWLEIKLRGSKSSLPGVGATVELKAGHFYRKLLARGDPVQVFSGALRELDVVRVTWPTAIIQNSVAVHTGQQLEVRESERLASSCPLLYVWDGTRYIYLTEVLGVAPLGALAPDGSRHSLNPHEFVRVPEWMRDQNGDYIFQFTNELREADYFDQVQLIAIDHDATEEVYANEIYSSQPAPPALFTVREKRFPTAATEDDGRDVLPLLRHRDGRYPSSFRHLRVPGVAELHSITLDFGDVPESESVALWLAGWVYWMDSNGARALLANRQVQVVPPQLQVRDPDGDWVTVIPDMGLPSGTDRTMRVDLTGKFLTSNRQVRIVTNLCVYWDQIFLSLNDGPPPLPLELPPGLADLHSRGFSTPVSDPEHRQPDFFDYERLLTEAPWNPLLGSYTRYGEVTHLVDRADDHLVVMATGDELTVHFHGRAIPPLPPGKKRTFFLYLFGWAKDGEPNTASSRTVEPLPYRTMPGYPYPGQRSAGGDDYEEYLRDYQSRPAYHWIPMLQPPGPSERE